MTRSKKSAGHKRKIQELREANRERSDSAELQNTNRSNIYLSGGSAASSSTQPQEQPTERVGNTTPHGESPRTASQEESPRSILENKVRRFERRLVVITTSLLQTATGSAVVPELSNPFPVDPSVAVNIIRQRVEHYSGSSTSQSTSSTSAHRNPYLTGEVDREED